MSRKDTERVVNAALDALTKALVSEGRVQISGFGIFETKQCKARIGRNPKTGSAVDIPESKKPVFKPSKALREAVDR